MVATTTGSKVSKHLEVAEELQVKEEGSTSQYKQLKSVGFLWLHILAVSP